MEVTSRVTYSGLNVQNTHSMKEIQRTESPVVCEEGVAYEKTISDSMSKGLTFMQDMEKKLEERQKAEQELKEHFGDRFKGFYAKWLEEEAKAEETAETEAAENTSDKESETISGSVGVNVGKTARKIAAAKTKEQLRTVMAEIRGDMQEVKAGIAKGWCDETEMDKVNSLMAMAQNRMGQVEDRQATPEEENMFTMASLL